MLSEIYNPGKTEKKIQKFWEKEKIYKFNPHSKKPIYSIDTPPPTVSGRMHLGHAFSYAQEDFIARYRRMKGEEVFYPFGTDDNGLATERLIEKLKKVKSQEMKRKDFIKLCLETLEEIKPEFIKDWKNLGMSCDFSLFYSTIDHRCQKISQQSFLELYKKNRVYQKEAPTIWCPLCQTAIAQAELKDKEFKSYFSDLIFKLDDPNFQAKDLIISTTRPELLPSCVAIFVHPRDERYKNLIGKEAIVPLFGQKVIILKDEKVETGKGTGIVMCCTFGDQTDIEWYLAHNLSLKISITKDGRMNEGAGKYQGLSLEEARKEILNDLKKVDLLVKQEKIKHTVNVHERCETPVEILNTKQWFIRYLDLKEEFLKIGREINWYPKHMKTRYENWIKGLRWDWCISRQRHFGIPFPIWYCGDCGQVILAREDQLPVDPLNDKSKEPCSFCESRSSIPEKDVLDTWATSSLTPQIAISLLPKTKIKLPMNLRPQAHDIIVNWLFYTVTRSYFQEKIKPWKEVMISGFVLDPYGEKMSKSKGNIVAPQDVMEKYGADCIRYWASGAGLGSDLRYSEKEIKEGKRLLTKIWNVAKFCLSHLKGYTLVDSEKIPSDFRTIDRWILSKLQKTIQKTSEAFEKYEYYQAREFILKFFWKDLADNYLELVKYRLYSDTRNKNDFSLEAAKFTLYICLLNILKFFSPILPHITEEIYQNFVSLFSKKSMTEMSKSIHLNDWPKLDKKFLDLEIEILGDKFIKILSAVRRYKAERKYSLKKEFSKVVIESRIQTLSTFFKDLEAAMNVNQVEFGRGEIEIDEEMKIRIYE